MNFRRLSVSRHWMLLWGAIVAGLTPPAALQAQPASPQVVDSLRREVEALREQVDSLRQALARQVPPAAAADQLTALRAAAAAAAAAVDTAAGAQRQGGAPQEFVGRERSLQALNPEISVNTDILAFANSEDLDHDNFVPREFEISFQAPLDPYSRAKIFVSHHTEGGTPTPFVQPEPIGAGEEEHAEGEAATEVEEGYLQWVNLPAGLGLSVGKLRQRFGTWNRWHRHALPGQSLPLPYTVFLGDEGLAQTGASLYWLVPVHGLGTYEIWFDVMRSGNERLFADSRKPNFLGHVNAFWELSPATYFEIGLSGTAGRREEDTLAYDVQLLSAEAAFNWRPPERALYQELMLRGAFLLNRRTAVAPAVDGGTSVGAFASIEYKLSQRWIAGLRYDYVENPDVAAEDASLIAPTLTWWQSEWVRIRAEYDILRGPRSTTRTFLLQFTFAMGPHKHETY
ncbi:MAG: hypothetical protein HY701_07385 [Gemmatimonadetes bacterium]|nr:hypothetical protein [Gemmatimonadota bacterium]